MNNEADSIPHSIRVLLKRRPAGACADKSDSSIFQTSRRVIDSGRAHGALTSAIKVAGELNRARSGRREKGFAFKLSRSGVRSSQADSPERQTSDLSFLGNRLETRLEPARDSVAGLGETHGGDEHPSGIRLSQCNRRSCDPLIRSASRNFGAQADDSTQSRRLGSSRATDKRTHPSDAAHRSRVPKDVGGRGHEIRYAGYRNTC